VGGSVNGLSLPFENLPLGAQIIFYFVFFLVFAGFIWTLILFVASRRTLRSSPEREPGDADGFLWVFFVPALDEAVTIADSVDRLLAVRARNKAILVIDDGSTDGTSEVLAGINHPEVEVLTRVAPDARRGKAAALNAAWRHVEVLLASERWSGWTRERVIVAVIDADGRLDPQAPEQVAAHFHDVKVGGLQALVRIYNRGAPLTWCQDVEFSVYGLLYQAARSRWGTAGMGGNGQFNRLAALDSIADVDARGPWRDRLTEDQDVGLRLIEEGWRNVSEASTSVDQQGVPSFRRLLRQRTRWAQGNLQAFGHLAPTWRTDLPLLVRLDLAAYLLQPAMQGMVGVAFVVSIFLAVFDIANYWGEGGWWQLVFFFLLGYGGVTLGCIARGAAHGGVRILQSLLVVPAYAAYSWTIWPVLIRATFRQLARRSDWAKTAREPITGGGDHAPS
jgi:1,2-diacylglycerol 3-beta-glucosyltransferase